MGHGLRAGNEDMTVCVAQSQARTYPDHPHAQKATERVLGLIERCGLAVLSAGEVSLLLGHKAEGLPFVTAFQERKVCEPCVHGDTYNHKMWEERFDLLVYLTQVLANR